MDSPPDQRENNVTATGTTGRFAGASLLPVPVMAAPIVLEKVYMKLKLEAFRVSGKFLQDRGIQGESADLIIQAWRQSTKKQYECYLRKWLKFSGSWEIDLLHPL